MTTRITAQAAATPTYASVRVRRILRATTTEGFRGGGRRADTGIQVARRLLLLHACDREDARHALRGLLGVGEQTGTVGQHELL